MRVSTRFEVFKRDGFTCQYCGRKTPDVVLEVDHIIPRVDGGGDALENLITACWDCNRGKGRKPLGKVAPAPDVEEQMAMLREREAQLREYHALRNEIATKREADLEFAKGFWSACWDYKDWDDMESYHRPYENVVRDAIKRLGLTDVLDAMQITEAKFRYVTTAACRYFGGILKNKIAESEGRVVFCTYCEERIVLTREQFAETPTGWYHTRCEPNGGE